MAAEAAISSAVELLGNLLIQKVKLLRGVEGKVRLLKDELESMQSFLIDANRKQAKDEGVRDWIRKIREIAFDAEDTIEMFVIKAECLGRRGHFERFISFPKRMHDLDQIGDEIDSIRDRLEAVDKIRERYGIQIVKEADKEKDKETSQAESRRRLCHWQKDEHLVSIKDAVEEVMREAILNEEKRGLSVAVIQGMGGIGKSTLAREIYYHPDVVGGPFDRRGWVVVSSEFTPHETIKQIIFQLSRSDEEKEKKEKEEEKKKNKVAEEIQILEQSTKDEHYILQKLQEMLYKQLEGSTYFIVMDDVWEQDHWKCFNGAFPNQQDKTSRLILTTRNKIIAKHDQYVFKMKFLDPEKSWELFLKKTFINHTYGTCPEELESIGKQILEKCDGLPLAISVAGGLLMDVQDRRRWQEVLDQIDTNIPKNNVPNILGLSYQNLCSPLKLCFLCLAFFKEDATIPSNELLSIWHALGLIQENGSRSIDDIGRGYLDELINRNMVQIKDLTLDGRVKNCHLHDLLREVCLVKAKEEMGFHIIERGEEVATIAPVSSSWKPRHRIVYGRNLDTLLMEHTRHLRSLFIVNSVSDGFSDVCVKTPFRFWKSFQLLEILYLEGVGWRSFPHSFRSLIRLRYLRIQSDSESESAERIRIPGWFGHLKRLEILDARSENLELPEATLEMDRLRYFSAARVHGLASIFSWKHVETLKYISVDDLLRCSTTSLSTCPVRELGLFLDREREGDVLKRARESMEEMMNLVKLELKWDLSLWIEPAMIPHLAGLTKLKLRGRMRRCPDPGVFPPNLTYLTLVHTFLEEDPMAELGKLQKLEYLKLSGYACLVERLRVLRGGFLGLKGLSIKDTYLLKRIDVEEGGMPQLKLLRIQQCPDLKTTNLPQRILASLSSV
ncbi:disease resistance protein RPP8-like [Salvia hispanica]|uniref:disease resistance protein RPP8-like n=1 Tax=Salvia hispanica TaxID=49212 RepID=UPI002008F259|nr:disease resistance protein RPP8-like [Salvia hispanica]